MHRLRHKAKAQVGRLLRVLFLWLGAVSTNSDAARRRVGCSVVLCLVGNEQNDGGHLARLARQQKHQRTRVVVSICRNHWRTVQRCDHGIRRASGKQRRAIIGEPHIGAALVPPEPTLRDGPRDPGSDTVRPSALSGRTVEPKASLAVATTGVVEQSRHRTDRGRCADHRRAFGPAAPPE